MKNKFPHVVYITHDENSNPPEDLLCWSSLETTDGGQVGVYTLTEVIEKREAVEIRRKGSKKWFKPE